MASASLSYRITPHAAGWRWEIVMDQRIVVEGDEPSSAAARAQACRALIKLDEVIRSSNA